MDGMGDINGVNHLFPWNKLVYPHGGYDLSNLIMHFYQVCTYIEALTCTLRFVISKS